MIKKELRTRPDYIDEYVWEQYQIHRKNIKKTMTDYQEHLCFIKLERARNNGHDPNELINESIEKGWQGIHIPDKPAGQTTSRNRGGWGLNPDYKIEQATEKFLKGKDVTIN